MVGLLDVVEFAEVFVRVILKMLWIWSPAVIMMLFVFICIKSDRAYRGYVRIKKCILDYISL